MMKKTIKPGQVWLDTDGKRIQAHGGSVIAVGDVFYWYGENKENTTGENEVWHNGVRCYSSRDLCSWKDEGIIIPPDYDDPASPLNPCAMMDRPHIVYNRKTKKYVCWLKIMGNTGRFAVLTADSILGPYKMVNDGLNPCGLDVGDFDLQVDENTGKGYVISEKPHTDVYIAELNDEYTDAVGKYTLQFHHAAPPESREAPAHFWYHGKHYLITSGTTGYNPNPSEIAVSDDWYGPYQVLGNPHRGDTSRTSFNSQISSVFHVPGRKDLYIAAADRWRPDLPQKYGKKWNTGEASDEIQARFQQIFDPHVKFVFTEEDAKDMRINSSVSDYVWLPLSFDENDRPYIKWTDEWSPDDYEEAV